jgi:hypothetical protein
MYIFGPKIAVCSVFVGRVYKYIISKDQGFVDAPSKSRPPAIPAAIIGSYIDELGNKTQQSGVVGRWLIRDVCYILLYKSSEGLGYNWKRSKK